MCLSLKKREIICLSKNSKGHAKYEKAIKTLCVAVSTICDFNPCDENSLFRKLVNSLHLNLEVCALKLNKLEIAIEVCSLILGVDMKNVKAFFRRGLALKKYEQLE